MMRISLHGRCQTCDPWDILSRAWHKIPEISIPRNSLCSFLQLRGELHMSAKQHVALLKDKGWGNMPLWEAARKDG